ncbi:UDP-glucose dehydrogenase [Klebsiella variicola]|uniref:UDP-glucose dehydrogenase n=1 Tax=Klebsiella variicola TaxID=244366 RepID=A0A7H4MAV3_KLEVA|nr:UDP-glucose dehydrogenase [Klebsiella variicola]
MAVETINRGEIHIVEAGSGGGVVKTAVEQGYLSATTTPVEADAYLIAVPTPFKDRHEPDMVFVESAAKSIADVKERVTGDPGVHLAGWVRLSRWPAGWRRCARISASLSRRATPLT